MRRSPESIEKRREYSRERWRSLNDPSRQNKKHDDIHVPSRINGKQNPEYQRLLYLKKYDERRAQQSEYRKTYRRKRDPKEARLIAISLLRARDGDDCWICGKDISAEDVTIDHIVPVSRGGAHTHDNVKLAHRACNIRRPRNGA